MTASLVRLECDGPIARVTLDRAAKRNALSRELLHQLGAAIEKVRADESLRVLVLQAEGPVFCAGMDLKEMEQRAAATDAEAQWQLDSEAYCEVLVALTTLAIPTIAAVQGPALAGGLGLVLTCDLVIAGENVFFALPEPKRGITAAVVTPLLHYRVGVSGSSWLLLSGERIDSHEAHRAGLCHEVVWPVELKPRVETLSRSILSGARSALMLSKQELLRVAGPMLVEQLKSARAVSAQARETADAREGLQAFLENRLPGWAVEDEDS
ncbi:MAG: enoyl-CoA hydratase [Planctomycetaceae bacterium]|nr:enoyl-CoA hydratase [Planctomycetaceae bacterium]